MVVLSHYRFSFRDVVASLLGERFRFTRVFITDLLSVRFFSFSASFAPLTLRLDLTGVPEFLSDDALAFLSLSLFRVET